MHILVTTDTLSEVWTYTRELVSGLICRGMRVTLVSFGEIPVPEQTQWMEKLHGLEYRPTAFRLDWMQDGEQDFADSSAYLIALIKEQKPDLLHLNHVCYGNLTVATPRLVVAHGDMINWWKSVHGQEPKETQWLSRYRRRQNDGLARADVVVAPTVWMLDALRTNYAPSRASAVIYHGRNPVFFNPYGKKDDSVLAIGRMLDPAKQVGLLTRCNHKIPISIVATDNDTQRSRVPIRADVKVATHDAPVSMKGKQTEAQMRALYSRSSIYVDAARYEPSGLNLIEAALSRCAVVVNDIPSMREMWGDSVSYFRANDAISLANTIETLSGDLDACRDAGNRAFRRAHECFAATRMIDDYAGLYDRILQNEVNAVAA